MEIVIITLGLILMAADGAVTVDGIKAFNSVRKIFNLDKDIPIGIMVNGPAQFCGVSFEKLFGEFQCFKFDGNYTAENVKNNLISFLESKDINNDLNEFIEFKLNDFKYFLENQLSDICFDEFEYWITNLLTHESYSFLTDLNIDFRDYIPDFVDDKDAVSEILLNAFSYKIFMESSEIIIAGFNEISKLPEYLRFKLIIKYGGDVVCEIVTFETDMTKPIILSFADDGEVKLFLNGIDLDLEKAIYNFFHTS